ncbi:hypothetical protein FA15DRAFT_709257 [Coprinopsis marcescibilis]|uniref:Nephrocystin 3-like N-terminal domain-containing protein n=1 Tax=Coprinopsis marcescibilis TaxID=230819 RepID=A0A5C3KGR9_COPMA|nr:hypothetical protein FA15DRAFT_709257 [Coprinopsis marcescibilis]
MPRRCMCIPLPNWGFSPPAKPKPPRSPDNRGINDPPANIHGRAMIIGSTPPILSNSQGTRNANLFAANKMVTNPSSEDVARGKELMLKNIASSALYNARGMFDVPQSQCDKYTRIVLLRRIRTWIEDRSSTSARLQCITGSAGIGKSALMQTTAEECEPAGLLAATFFFSGSDPDRNNLQSFIPTIAYQIALSNKSDPALGNCIFRAVNRDPSYSNALSNGYVKVFSSPSFPHLISIDGLDECIDRKSQTKLLQIISTFINKGLPFKILLASQPERPLQAAILGSPGYLKGKSEVINLNDYDASADIRNVLRAQLRTIGQESDDPRTKTNWPSPDDIAALVDAAAGLFVYASTVVKFVSQRHRQPFLQLKAVIQVIRRPNPTGRAVPVLKNPYAELDALYRSIFAFAQKDYANLLNDDDPLVVIRLVRMFSLPLPSIKLVAVYSNPSSSAPGTKCTKATVAYGVGSRNQSVAEMEEVFQLEPGQLEYMFSNLDSLYTVKVGASRDAVLRPNHKSVQDFLLDPTRCGEDLYIPDYLVVGKWTTVILGILAKASDSMLARARRDDTWSTSDARRLKWADFEMPYHVPLPSAFREDAQWSVIMEEWHRIYKPFADQRLFSRLARTVRGGTISSQQFIGQRTFCLILGFMLYEAPRLAGIEWEPIIFQEIQVLFETIKEIDTAYGKVPNDEFPGLGEGEPVSREYLSGWFREILDHQPIGNIYPWPGETVGVKLRLSPEEDSDEQDSDEEDSDKDSDVEDSDEENSNHEDLVEDDLNERGLDEEELDEKGSDEEDLNARSVEKDWDVEDLDGEGLNEEDLDEKGSDEDELNDKDLDDEDLIEGDSDEGLNEMDSDEGLNEEDSDEGLNEDSDEGLDEGLDEEGSDEGLNEEDSDQEDSD